jgi:hypothetical protein
MITRSYSASETSNHHLASGMRLKLEFWYRMEPLRAFSNINSQIVVKKKKKMHLLHMVLGPFFFAF